jgi:hypothetical protein
MQTDMKWLMLAAALALPHMAAIGHEAGMGGLPEQPGFYLNAGAALSLAHAQEPWPAVRLPGVLTRGTTPVDRRGGALEHATLGLGLRLHEHLGGLLVAGWHDTDPAHLEAAWLQAEAETDQHQFKLGAGRHRLPMGTVLESGGHYDRHAAMPLAKRAVLDDDWIDTGVNLHWERDADAADFWPVQMDVGLWKARSFPGGDGARPAPALHVQWAWGPVLIDGFMASVSPSGRGGYIQNSTSGHTHEQPDCSGDLLAIFCFDGHSEILGGSINWALPIADLRMEAAGLLRRDRGQLFSRASSADYRGSTGGGWLDLIWPISRRITLSARGEFVRGVHTLNGVGALAVAQDAGLMGNTSIQRGALAASYAFGHDTRISVELGDERIGPNDNPYALIRLVWTPDRLWSWSP